MSQEIEAKYRVQDFRAVRKALRAAGAVHLCTVIETDRFWDTPDARLLGADCAIRLRTFQRLAGPEFDDRPLLTHKGPAEGKTKFKTRPEHQTKLDDAGAIGCVLAAAGLEVTLTLQKRRERYSVQDCHVELDELPIGGQFVEIEGPGESDISRVAAMLGLADFPPIREHYVRIVQDACSRVGLPCRTITFETCPSCC